MAVFAAAPAHGQRAASAAKMAPSVALETWILQPGARITDGGKSSNAMAKGAGIGLLVGTLAGVAVGAMLESSNQGGSPDIREKYRGFGYAVFVPAGAIVGAVVGAVVGARRH